MRSIGGFAASPLLDGGVARGRRSGAVVWHRRERVVVWTSLIVGEAGRSGQIQEMCKESRYDSVPALREFAKTKKRG